MLALAFIINNDYRVTIRDAETTTRNYAAIMEARLDDTLRRADATTLELAHAVPVEALSKQAAPRYAQHLDAELDLRLLNFTELSGLRIFDSDGDLLYTSDSKRTRRANIADRDHFRRLRDDPQSSLLFSGVNIARTSGLHSVAIARALRDEKGHFRGVVIAVMHLNNFQKLLASLDVGPNGIISTYSTDTLRPIVRNPQNASMLNRQIPDGHPTRIALANGNKKATIRFTSTSDGVERIYSLHALENYPFFVSTGLAIDDVLADWGRLSVKMALLYFLIIGLLGVSTYRQQKTQRLLQTNEERFRSLTALSSDWYWEQDASLRFTMWSKPVHPGVHADIESPIGKLRWEQPIIGLSNEQWQAHRAALARHEAFADLTYQVKNEAGTLSWISVSGKPMFCENDVFRGYRGVGHDITKRKCAELELQESRSLLSNIIDSALDGIITADEQQRILVFNRAAECMFGCAAATMIGRPVAHLVPERLRTVHDGLMQALISTDNSLAMTLPKPITALRADDTEFPVDATVTYFNNDEKKMFTILLRDIIGRIAAAEAQRDTLVREVHHRIKNNLQGVVGLARQHVAAHPELKTLAEEMISKIRVISIVHGLQGVAVRGQITLCELVAEISNSARSVTQTTIDVTDLANHTDSIRLSQDESVPLALILHELLYNAIKHGTNENADGGIQVRISGDPHLVQVGISNAGTLPAGFDFDKDDGTGTGLGLVKSLLPGEGAKLAFAQQNGRVIVTLELSNIARSRSS